MEEKPHTTWVYMTNLFHFISWVHIFVGSLVYFVSLWYPFMMSSEKILSTILLILKITQTLQFSDMIFSFFKLTKGSTFGSFFQVFGRNFIVWFVLTPKNSNIVLALILLDWSFADSVRYLYYIYPNSFSLFLRYVY